jgi:hypothetical protein
MSFDVATLKSAADDLATAVAAKEQAQTLLSAAKASQGDTQANFQQELAKLKAKYEQDVADLTALYGKAAEQAQAQVSAAEKAVADAGMAAAGAAGRITQLVAAYVVSLPLPVSMTGSVTPAFSDPAWQGVLKNAPSVFTFNPSGGFFPGQQ